MPYAVDGLGAIQNIGGWTPLSGSFLTGKNKPGSVGARKAGKAGRQVLTPSLLRIQNQLYRLGKVVGRHGSSSMVFPPGAEQLCDSLAARIPGFESFYALDGIPAPQSQKRIAAPRSPGRKASKWFAFGKRRGVLTAPPPDRQQCCEQFGTLLFNCFQESSLEWT
jgi:hypothetical protein